MPSTVDADLTQALLQACRLVLRGAGGRPITFDTWALGQPLEAERAMRQVLKTLAIYRGKSVFGNDWQDAAD